MASRGAGGYAVVMDISDELTGLLQFVSALDSGEMTIQRKGEDVTAIMAEDLRRDITALQAALVGSSRAEGG